jgi:O-methyltransferase domain
MTERPASPEYLRDLLVGHIPVQLACAMAGLRLADLLADGPMTVEELSAAAKARPDLLRRLPFDGGMTRLALGVIDEALAHYDFSAAKRILDVGGGRGHFAAAVLEAYPQLEGAVLDVPAVMDAANEYLRGRDLGERSVAIGGNFFDSVPAGYDLHILKWILHDWNDASCRQLLARCRAALPADGRLLVVELLLPDEAAVDGRVRPAIQADLFMLVNFDSRERSLDEYERLLGDSGFALERAIALPSSFSILDFRPQ